MALTAVRENITIIVIEYLKSVVNSLYHLYATISNPNTATGIIHFGRFSV